MLFLYIYYCVVVVFYILFVATKFICRPIPSYILKFISETNNIEARGDLQGCGKLPNIFQEGVNSPDLQFDLEAETCLFQRTFHDDTYVVVMSVYDADRNKKKIIQYNSNIDCNDLFSENDNFVAQSEIIAPVAATHEISNEETVEFHDETCGLTTGFYREIDTVSGVDRAVSAELGDFLSRPVRIANFVWNESDSVGTTHSYSPWNLFFTDTRIKKKLDNYAFLQCDLKVKIMINASPFYYGGMLVNYIPLPNLTPSTIVVDGSNRHLILQSQRPKLWLYPQDNEGGEMILPYFNFRNWIRIGLAQDFTDMGTLNFFNYTALASANGISGTGVPITVYAWAENVRVSGATLGLAAQSGIWRAQSDEYGNGCISKPASAVSYAASFFENIPIIGNFAKATRIGASAVSSIASLFGFTNVPVIADTMPFRNTPFPQLSSPEIAYPIEKLTVDPKNELTIDPGVLGLPSTDELAIGNLISKESFLTTASWTTAQAVDTILFTSVVTPNLFDSDLATNAAVYMTPMSWISNVFKAWRGDVNFRFRFVASQFHKGRVRISYDPAGTSGENLTSDAISSSVVFTQIVDLSKDTDVVIRIPYQQAIAWLLVNTGNFATIPFSISATPTYIFNNAFHNGTIQVRVLNALTAPVATSTVPILVFVSAADNVEFANPSELPANMSTFTAQSQTVYGTPSTTVAGVEHKPADNRYLVNWGEAIPSLRTLLRRTNLSNVWCEPTQGSSNPYCIIRQRQSKWPLYYGYDTNGIHQAKGLVLTSVNFQFNFAQNTLYNWLAPAYIGQRGSMIWTFNVDSGVVVNNVKVIRIPNNTGNAVNTVTAFTKGTVSANAAYFLSETEAQSTGSALTSQQTQAGLSVLCPNYNPYRFQTTAPKNASNPQTLDASDQDNILIEVSSPGDSVAFTTSLKIWKYVSIGTDFNLHFFLNVPSMQLYSSLPIAN